LISALNYLSYCKARYNGSKLYIVQFVLLCDSYF